MWQDTTECWLTFGWAAATGVAPRDGWWTTTARGAMPVEVRSSEGLGRTTVRTRRLEPTAWFHHSGREFGRRCTEAGTRKDFMHLDGEYCNVQWSRRHPSPRKERSIRLDKASRPGDSVVSLHGLLWRIGKPPRAYPQIDALRPTALF